MRRDQAQEKDWGSLTDIVKLGRANLSTPVLRASGGRERENDGGEDLERTSDKVKSGHSSEP